MFGSNTDEMVAELRERYGNGTIVIYPDPASRQRKTSAGGRTDLSILQNAGFEVRVRNSHAAVRDRINAVNSRLLSNDGVRRLYVDPKCKKVIESLERHTYKEGTSQPEKDGGFDHMNDALGYAVEYLFPIRKATAPQAPQRWTYMYYEDIEYQHPDYENNIDRWEFYLRSYMGGQDYRDGHTLLATSTKTRTPTADASANPAGQPLPQRRHVYSLCGVYRLPVTISRWRAVRP